MTTTDATTPTPATTPATDPVAEAAAIALGEAPADPGAAALTVRSAHRDINCRGRGEEWHRLRRRPGEAGWSYFGGRLPPPGRLAEQRHATATGDAYPGDLLAQHDRGGPIDQVYLVHRAVERDGKRVLLTPCRFSRRRDGMFTITLPGGASIVLPDPRRR